MTGLDSLERCPKCRSADMVHVHFGVGGKYRCMQCDHRFNKPFVAASVYADALHGGPTDVQMIFVLLAEIRRCINDDNLIAAQNKILAVETIFKASLKEPTRN